MKKNLSYKILYIIVIITVSYGINLIIENIRRYEIPLNTIFFKENKVLINYIDSKSSEWKIVLHDYKNGITKNISNDNIFSKCTPIYYNDSIILGFFEIKTHFKYSKLNLETFQANWISEEEKKELMPSLKLISYPGRIDDNNYDPEKLPNKIFTDKNFKSALYIKDNDGNIIQYKGLPLIAIYTNEIYKEFVNIYSKNNWRIADYISKKCFIGLYDDKAQKFEWIYNKNLNKEAFNKIFLYYGVLKLKNDKVLLINSDNTEILDLKTGIVTPNTKIAF
jgi:hypothetical protein